MAVLSAPTIEELIQDVRNMLSQPSATNSNWSDEELAVYLNEAIRRYFAEVVQHAEGQFTTVDDLNITADSETIALPADFFSVRRVWKKVNQGYEILHYRNALNEGYSTAGGSNSSVYLPSYYLRGNSLVLHPVPNFSETDGIRVEYVQFPETLVTGGDSMTAQVSPVFKDLIEMYAVYKAKLKESLTNGTNTYAPARENLNDLFTAFKEALPKRSSNPTAVQPFNPEEE
jgi:hypothetical protein